MAKTTKTTDTTIPNDPLEGTGSGNTEPSTGRAPELIGQETSTSDGQKIVKLPPVDPPPPPPAAESAETAPPAAPVAPAPAAAAVQPAPEAPPSRPDNERPTVKDGPSYVITEEDAWEARMRARELARFEQPLASPFEVAQPTSAPEPGAGQLRYQVWEHGSLFFSGQRFAPKSVINLLPDEAEDLVKRGVVTLVPRATAVDCPKCGPGTHAAYPCSVECFVRAGYDAANFDKYVAQLQAERARVSTTTKA